MEFAQIDWGQCGTINKIKVLTKQVTDILHDVIQKKDQKYLSTTILKHANVLDKVNK